MIRGRVVGQIWSSKRIETVPNGALLTIETDKGEQLVAFDPLGCAQGEAVLVTRGSAALGYFANKKAAIDALIIGSIDEDN